MDTNVSLWQFLLQLLLSQKHASIISWTDGKGEFKLLNPEEVAKLWGIRKNKPKMNYDKLSRALRYYYGREIIKKANSKKFVYRFVNLPTAILEEINSGKTSKVSECLMESFKIENSCPSYENFIKSFDSSLKNNPVTLKKEFPEWYQSDSLKLDNLIITAADSSTDPSNNNTNPKSCNFIKQENSYDYSLITSSLNKGLVIDKSFQQAPYYQPKANMSHIDSLTGFSDENLRKDLVLGKFETNIQAHINPPSNPPPHNLQKHNYNSTPNLTNSNPFMNFKKNQTHQANYQLDTRSISNEQSPVSTNNLSSQALPDHALFAFNKANNTNFINSNEHVFKNVYFNNCNLVLNDPTSYYNNVLLQNNNVPVNGHSNCNSIFVDKNNNFGNLPSNMECTDNDTKHFAVIQQNNNSIKSGIKDNSPNSTEINKLDINNNLVIVEKENALEKGENNDDASVDSSTTPCKVTDINTVSSEVERVDLNTVVSCFPNNDKNNLRNTNFITSFTFNEGNIFSPLANELALSSFMPAQLYNLKRNAEVALSPLVFDSKKFCYTACEKSTNQVNLKPEKNENSIDVLKLKSEEKDEKKDEVVNKTSNKTDPEKKLTLLKKKFHTKVKPSPLKLPQNTQMFTPVFTSTPCFIQSPFYSNKTFTPTLHPVLSGQITPFSKLHFWSALSPMHTGSPHKTHSLNTPVFPPFNDSKNKNESSTTTTSAPTKLTSSASSTTTNTATFSLPTITISPNKSPSIVFKQSPNTSPKTSKSTNSPKSTLTPPTTTPLTTHPLFLPPLAAHNSPCSQTYFKFPSLSSSNINDLSPSLHCDNHDDTLNTPINLMTPRSSD